MAQIDIEGLKKVYPNGVEAVKQVDLRVADGEFMVLVGPSGCGKTTLLRMVAGLESITDGTLRFGDRVMNDLSPRDRDIAMVFQNYALYPHMTVSQNIGFALKVRGMASDEISRRVGQTAEILGLSDWLERKPGQLSGGQRQRVAMGRAIVREPSVFLMDEPLSNLDAKLRVEMRTEVNRVQRQIGVATIYVTHDQVEAMTMGDRVAVLRDGELQQCDAPQTLYERPANVFVGGFIGSPAMNLYDATLESGATGIRIGSQAVGLPDSVVASRPQLSSYSGRSVIVGLRPEHLKPTSDSGAETLVADVGLVEALGNEKLVHFSLDARRVVPGTPSVDEVLERGEGIARVDPQTPVKRGDRASFEVDATRMHFFDPESGRAIC